METRETLMRQLDTAWRLTCLHLDGLTTEECLWQPGIRGPHVRRRADGVWQADWPEHEGYDLGPPSIGWIAWHIGYWWSMVLDHSFGAATLTREAVMWPGDADAVGRWLAELHQRWVDEMRAMSDDDFRSAERTRWPFANRPFADVSAWVNIELTKNAAEIGYARFLYAARRSQSSV
jgi:hypothetical protein